MIFLIDVATRVRNHRSKFSSEKKAQESTHVESVRKKRLADMTSDEKNDYTKRSKNFENKSHARKRNNPEICNYVKIETRWQYFATSHGKGIVDGIGGAAKSCEE